MKILIIEDEPAASGHLQKILQQLKPSADINIVLDSVETGIQYFKNGGTADLIFTDIQLGDGLSFEIFSEIEPPAPLIFTTAFDEYAIKAFKFNSLDYLLKPYKKSDVEQALIKFEKTTVNNTGDLQIQIKEILKGLQGNTEKRTRFLFQSGTKLIPVEAAEILWFDAEDKYVYAHTVGGASYICDETLDQLEMQLDVTMFFRISRGMILNRRFISSVSRYFSGRLKLETQPALPGEVTVSRERVPAFRAWLGGN